MKGNFYARFLGGRGRVNRSRLPGATHTRMLLTVTLWVVFLAVLSLVLWSMWMRGEISSVAPRTHRERVRLWWVVAGVVNLAAFVVHVMIDHGSAFPTGGRLVDGVYLVMQHGRDIPFTPGRYLFSFLHGLFAVIVHLVCMIAVWRLRRTGGLKDETRVA